ncbi:hypothetical protein ONE63_011598 [Megalurothrips usitatus]|uniref:HTH CENPB-type domain-containing protein n=1 Tax=Megalurothrips usitatus TaxID=439358 RepID=A0AAV7WYV1_9NEOP|nr:hypothetical protein ONE63_011598 [Megalurothrips usitatus]
MRVREGKFEKLEEDLVEWLRSARAQKIPISGSLLCTKAIQFAKVKGITDFKASNGWLTRFRRRHNLLFKTLHGESGIKALPCPYKAQNKACMTGPIFIEWLKSVDGKMRAQRRSVILFVDNCPAHPTDLDFLTNVKVEFLPKNCTSRLQPLDQGILHNFKYFYRKRVILRLLNFVGNEGATKKDMMLNLLQALHFLQWAWLQVKPETIKNCFRQAGFRFGLPPPQSAGDAASATPASAAVRPAATGGCAAADPRTSAAARLEEESVDDPEGHSETEETPQPELSGSESEADEAEEERICIEIEEDFEETWSAIRGLFGGDDLSIEEFLCFDDDVLTHQPLTEEEILAAGTALPEKECEDDDEALAAQGTEPRVLTQADGLRALSEVREFVGQLPGVDDEAFLMISKLETLGSFHEKFSRRKSTIDDFVLRLAKCCQCEGRVLAEVCPLSLK